MVEHSQEKLDLIFKALSDPTRRGILARLSERQLMVTELAADYQNKMSLAAVSKHLKVLESAGLINKAKDGRVYRCSVNLAPLSRVTTLLEELGFFWRGQLDSLENYFSNKNMTNMKLIKEKENANSKKK